MMVAWFAWFACRDNRRQRGGEKRRRKKPTSGKISPHVPYNSIMNKVAFVLMLNA